VPWLFRHGRVVEQLLRAAASAEHIMTAGNRGRVLDRPMREVVGRRAGDKVKYHMSSRAATGPDWCESLAIPTS